MAGKKHNYKEKRVIISLFNESQSNYKIYEENLLGNAGKAQMALNTAAYKLQQSFELGIKCYLNKRYKELCVGGELIRQDCLKLVQIIENGRQLNGQLVDIRYLYEQMELYASPKISESDVNFDLIKRNIKPIYNENKHIGSDVEVEKYKDSYKEIRKFILEYIDPNPPIQMVQSPEYINLQEACDFWDKDSRYNYCLVCDKTSLDNASLKKLLYIGWSLIIDFDTRTDRSGLQKAYIDEYGVQPNSFDILNPKATVFNAASVVPYWFHVCGVEDIGESIAETDRKWNQKYGSQLFDSICRYHEVFTKPIKVVILSGDTKKLSQIITALDAVYEDSLKLYLLSSEVQYENIKEDYEEILEYFPLTEYDFAQGIENFSSLFNRTVKREAYNICSKDGKVGIKLDDYSCFEIPYLGIADEECDDEDRECEKFYQGERPLSWYGVKNGFAINRIKQYRRIKSAITNASVETTSKIVRLYHDPGAGGTTLSRMIAYDLSKEMPVVLLTSYNSKIAPKQLMNLYKQVRMSVIIVVEGSIISEEDLQKLNGELMANAVAHVILYVNRISRVTRPSDDDLRMLSDVEFGDMFEKLQVYIDEERQEEVKKRAAIPPERYPFFMSMYAFQEQFKGVKDYIKHYLVGITQNDLNNLSYISMVDKFANRPLDINFLLFYDKDDPVGIFENSTNKNLISVLDSGQNRQVKIRHPRFADEIINERISVMAEDDGLKKAENLSKLIREFIKFSKQNIMYDFDSTIDVLKNLLILRDTDSMVKNKFSAIIQYMKTLIPDGIAENDKYNCIGLVFKELVSVYPEEPHFKAHLSRYYTHIEKNYEKGIVEAKEAVEFAEQQGIHDPLLYHIYGMSIRRYVEQKLFSDAKECRAYGETEALEQKLDEIKRELELASEQFLKVRGTNNKVAGYISDIEMCISVVDFGKEIFGCSTEEFIDRNKDSWFMSYYDRALTLMEGFRTIQVEEDTEFHKIHLSAKCNESLQDMMVNIEKTLFMWEEYLLRATEIQQPVVRRFIARAKEKMIMGGEKVETSDIEMIMKLMEENIKQEPSNGANIRIWFNALRYLEENDADMLLDEALQKLATWKQIGDNFEAYYYYFILICIKAIEGSSRAEAIIPSLQEELKVKTAHMPNNRVIYEWLGEGRGVKRLINAYENSNGKATHRRSLEVIENEACYLEGRIAKYSNDRSAQIRAYNMEVFFSPSGQMKRATEEDINKKVKFILGFSYDGLRALNRSVEIIDGSADENELDEMVGKRVKCRVFAKDSNGNFLKVKLVDYRNMYGSIHSSELPQGKTVYDYKEQDIIWGTIVGERFVQMESRTYYQIRMKEEEEILEDWQKQLMLLKEDLRS